MSITYQHPNTISSNGFEAVEVHDHTVACDGGGGALGHPKVYLEIDRAVGHITCPYCSRSFILSRHHAA